MKLTDAAKCGSSRKANAGPIEGDRSEKPTDVGAGAQLRAKTASGKSSPRFTAQGCCDATPFTIPFTTHPWGWLLRVGLEGG